MPKAVVTSVHALDAGLIVGAHHVARELARRGWRVALLSSPVSLVHIVGSFWHEPARRRLRAALASCHTAADGLASINPVTLLPLARNFGAGSRTILRLWPWLSYPVLPLHLKAAGFEGADLLFLDSPLTASLRGHIRPRRTVLRIFDDTSDEPPWPRALVELMAEVAAGADAVAVTAPSLLERAAALGARRVHLMPNGADVEHFSRAAAEPADLAPIPPPRVVYAGALAPWVHFELMAEVAARMPDVSFVWIGPGEMPQACVRPNVHRLGARPYAALPGYLQHGDVGIIPFDRDRHTKLVDSVHPLKLYDYLAAGLPVVATPWAELERIAPPARFARTPGEMVAAIRASLREGAPARSAFLQRATWAARVDGLLEAIG
jgi:glycosyltransferase involved in cell wall biosynthesis